MKTHIASSAKPSKGYFLALAAGLALAAAATSHAQTIYSDSFTTGANGTALTGGTPDVVDRTGATYVTTARGGAAGFPTYSSTGGNPGGTANTSFSDAAALSLASAGTFTRGTTFTLSADLSIGTIGGTSTGSAAAGGSTRGLYLGFFSSAFASGAVNNDSTTGFTGFALQNNGAGGILQFINNGDSTGATVPAPSATLTGTLSTTAFYRLSLTVNTTTGNLTSIIFNGTDLTSTFATGTAGTFTNAATAYAGFGASGNAVGQTGLVDNLVVGVPEPGTWAMALAGVGMLVGVQRFRMRKA